MLLPLGLSAQRTNYLAVLDMSSSARTAGLGMDFLSVADGDGSVALDNPCFIPGVDGRLTLNYVDLFNGANFGQVAYGKHWDKVGDFLFGLRFNSYGTFEGFDEMEHETNRFFAADYAFLIGWGRHIDSCFSIGVNLKPTLSQYAHYTAFALAMDIAGSYTSRSKRFSATLMGRNIGAQLATFNGSTEKLPFELSLGLSYKLENAPFRLYFAATELQHWHLRYDDPLNPVSTSDPYTGEWSQEGFLHKAADLTFRHAVFGIELNISKVFYARLGYNYRKSVENHGTDNINTSGFSYGLGLQKKRFSIDLARNNYYLGKAPTYVTLAIKL